MEQKIRESLNSLYPLHFTKIESVTNEMYRCVADQGIFFARITNYKKFDEQVEEVTYTNFLYGQGFGVSPTIPSLNGSFVERVTLDKEVLMVLYKKAPGIHLPRQEWNARVLNILGRQIGRLHRLSKEYEKRETVKHISDWYDLKDYDFLSYIPKEEITIREMAQDVISSIKNLPQSESTYGLLHGDIWLENILVDSDKNLTIIDFQDCEKNYYLFDLAVPIYSAMEYSYAGNGNIVDYGRSITKAIIEGYREEHELPSDMLDNLPLFIRLKELFEYTLMHRYWNQDKLTEEQIRIMNHFRIRFERNHSIIPSL